MLCYVFDVVTDTVIAVSYYEEGWYEHYVEVDSDNLVYILLSGHSLYMGLTLIFLLVPGLIVSALSLRMYLKHADNQETFSIFRWGFRIFCSQIARYSENCISIIICLFKDERFFYIN